MALVGRPELVSEPWFATGRGRAQHAAVLDEAVGRWVGERPADVVERAFEAAEAAVAPVYDVRDILADPQFAALGTIARVDDPDFGTIAMQNLLFRLTTTPGSIRWTVGHGRRHRDDPRRPGDRTRELERLRNEGVCSRHPSRRVDVLTALYVPGDRPDRFEKALGPRRRRSDLDLEDAVAPAHKAEAREAVAAFLKDRRPKPLQVRINGPDTPWGLDDLAAVTTQPGLTGLRIPKVESLDTVQQVAQHLAPDGSTGLHLLIETARGVESAFALATADPRVASIALGEADLRSDLMSRTRACSRGPKSDLVAARAAGARAKAVGLPESRMRMGWRSCREVAP